MMPEFLEGSCTMTKSFSTVLAALALTAMLGTVATPALADSWGHGGHGGGRGGGHGYGGHGYGGYGRGGYYGYGLGLGLGLGYGLGYYGYGYPWDYGYGYGGYGYGAYGYPYGSPYDYSAAGPPAQPQLAPPQPAPAAQSFWYFCRSSNAYYPYVSSCREAWQRVPMTPPPQG
jgi:hypothetical protein